MIHNLTHTHTLLVCENVGVISACKWRWGRWWKLFFMAANGDYEGYVFELHDLEEAAAVQSSQSGDEAINAVAALRGEFEVVVDDEDPVD